MVIDIHTHLTGIVDFMSRDSELPRAVSGVFGYGDPAQPMSTFMAALDEAGIDRAVVLPIDCTTAHGCRVFSNDLIAEIVQAQPRLIGFASVDPNLSDAPEALERAVVDHGLCGLKLDPALQLFDIDDRELAFPVYGRCSELGIPLLIHCGLSWAPLGRSSRAQPLRLEAVVHEFPDLKVIIAHAGWPWVADALMLALKYPNVYLDTAVIYSGTPADSVRHVLADEIGLDVVRRSLHSKILYGSNAPRIRPKRGVAAVRALGLDPVLEGKILHDNAAALLGLEEMHR
jgi:predicted TIM-barrel fold metal-dependent hydrolase